MCVCVCVCVYVCVQCVCVCVCVCVCGVVWCGVVWCSVRAQVLACVIETSTYVYAHYVHMHVGTYIHNVQTYKDVNVLCGYCYSI